jgi:hypothetical protein
MVWVPAWLGRGNLSTWIDGVSQERKDEVREYAAGLGVRFDTRDSIEVLLDRRARGIDIVPAVYPVALLQEAQHGALQSVVKIDGREVLPLGGISNRATLLCNENGEYTSYASDERGFHNPAGTWSGEPLDIAIVGDSFAHGFCVGSDENFTALIRRRFPATLTLGMGGNGPILELAGIQEYLPRLRPKVVLWAYFGKNDLIELRNEARSPLLLRYLRPAFRQGLASLQPQIDGALLDYVEAEKSEAVKRLDAGKNHKSRAKRLLDFAKLSALRSRLEIAEHPASARSPADAAADLTLFRAVLLRAKRTVESWGGSLYFVYLPEWERYARPDLVQENRDQVLQAAADLGLEIIDIHQAFAAHPDVLSLFPLRRSGHYNAAGNALVAQAVLKRLEQ